MRGKVPTAQAAFHLTRITPAHAGKRQAHAPVCKRAEDHPRPCGEKDFAPNCRWFRPGSPPPMRGKVFPASPRIAGSRITPAHAGKSGLAFGMYGRLRDHPRPCGEKSSHRHWTTTLPGSPPPMRGKASGAAGGDIQCGITPAHAGKRAKKYRRLSCRQDHPRPCGEKSCVGVYVSQSQGSPPPMRGKAASGSGVYAIKGITPAHAGKRRSGCWFSGVDEDHPRPCGEK